MCIALLFSCTKDAVIGEGSDDIKLSQKEVSFTYASESVLITTEGDGWWFTEISLDGNFVSDLSTPDLMSKNIEISTAEFIIMRKNGKEIHISMPANATGSEHLLFIGVQSGNYVDSIHITQSVD